LGRPFSAGASRELRRFRFTGLGFKTLGDAWLAESGAARAREQRRIAREELRGRPLGAASRARGVGEERSRTTDTREGG
jgi:hypothetical protein